MRGWQVLLEGVRSGAAHMAHDEALARRGQSAVRFFRWRPGMSFGWKQALPAWADGPAWGAAGLDRVERPTGGGIAFHGSDVSVSVVVPRACHVAPGALLGAAAISAARLCAAVAVEAQAVLEDEAQGRVSVCLTERSPYAVRSAGRKLAGFALRRYPQSWLIQGSLLAHPVPGALEAALPAHIKQALSRQAISLSEAGSRVRCGKALQRLWAEGWAGWWDEALGQGSAKACVRRSGIELVEAALS